MMVRWQPDISMQKYRQQPPTRPIPGTRGHQSYLTQIMNARNGPRGKIMERLRPIMDRVSTMQGQPQRPIFQPQGQPPITSNTQPQPEFRQPPPAQTQVNPQFQRADAPTYSSSSSPSPIQGMQKQWRL